jgi:cell wall-associated NlpC family hydrolase
MSMAEGLVQAVGVVLGATRDSFGVGGVTDTGFSSTSGSSPVLAAAVFQSGQTASASSGQSSELDGLFSALGQQDVAANANVQGALDSSGAGRGQMDGVIAATLDDVTGLAPSTNSNTGLQALVNALAARLEQAWQTLTDGNSQASTHAASSAQVAAGYNSLVTPSGTGVASTGTLSAMGGLSASAVPATTMAATQPAMTMEQVWVPASAAAASTAAASAAQVASTQQAAATQPTTATLTSVTKKTSANVQNVINRAKKYLGTPYVWGGGNAAGPSGSAIDVGAADGKPGFDCSGLTLYAYAGAGITLPHNANAQMLGFGTTIARQNIQPGDLIFSNFDEEGPGTGAGHVQMAIGSGANAQIIEAPHTGAYVQTGSIESGKIVIKRLLSS